MPRRGENIYKRKDSRWEGRVLQPDGKYRYFYAKAYREVKEKMKTAKEKHLTPKKTITQTQGFAVQQFEGWLAGNMAQQVKPSTYENYYRCMHCYTIPFFSEKGNELLTEHTAKLFVKSIRENGSISESYQKKILTIFKTAVRQILNSSPECLAILSAIQLPKIEETEIQVFSMKEQRKVEAAALHSSDSRALGVILCFYTGIRLGELCALKWGDIDLETGAMSIQRTVARTKNFREDGGKTALTVGTPKSRKSLRKIPLPGFLLNMVKEHSPSYGQENKYVFSGSSEPADPRMYQKFYKKLLKSAQVPERKFHTIRHTFATRALELGVDIKTLSELLGHSTVSITLNVYAHSLMEQKKIAIHKFEEMHVSYMNHIPFTVTAAVAGA